MSFDEHLRDPERDADFAREEAWFEYNRVEISLGTLLLFVWFLIDDVVAWCLLVALVLFAVTRRLPVLGPALVWFWRVCLMPLAKTDDWIMARWADTKRWYAAKQIQWREDWQILRAWLREALKPEKTEHVAAAMAQHQYLLAGRAMSPLAVLGQWLPVLCFGLGIMLAGAIQEWRIGRVKGEARELRVERNEAAERARGWEANAIAEGKARAELEAQRNADVIRANAENAETARLLEAERRRASALARRERALNDTASKAAAGGPPPDWGSLMRERLGVPDAGESPVSDGGGSTPPGGDPPG